MKTEFIEQDKSLETVVENENQRILREALMRLGPNGENWCKGSFESNSGKFCMHGAVINVRPLGMGRWQANRVLSDMHGGSCIAWNDAPERTFDDVRAAFHRAIDLAGHKALPQ